MALINLSQIQRLNRIRMDRSHSQRTIIHSNACKFHENIPVIIDEKK